jgi:hypothetical protein
MPKISTASDLIAAAAALTDAVSQGEITPGEAASLSTLVGNTAKAVEIFELADRLAVSKSRWPRKEAPREPTTVAPRPPRAVASPRGAAVRDRRRRQRGHRGQDRTLRAETGLSARDLVAIVKRFCGKTQEPPWTMLSGVAENPTPLSGLLWPAERICNVFPYP